MNQHQEKFFNFENLLIIDQFQSKSFQFQDLDNQNCLDLEMENGENDIDFFSSDPKEEETSQLREIQQTDHSSSLLRKTKKQGCHCKKTKCLKMYCECFSQGNICTQQCVCIGCYNDQKHHKSKFEKPKSTLHQAKIINNSEVIGQKVNIGKGCNCKKSHCQKRYCECFNSGSKCNQHCQCIQCNNCLSSELIQKYKSSSVVVQKNEQIPEQQNEKDIYVKQQIQITRKQEPAYIVMSKQLLAQIDGYITG